MVGGVSANFIACSNFSENELEGYLRG